MIILLFTYFVFSHEYISTSYACVADKLYYPNGQSIYIGNDKCKNAIIKNNYACIDGTLYLPNGLSRFIGNDACDKAKF